MPDDHEITRQRVHDLADTMQAFMVKTAVIEERQVAVASQLDRIESAVTRIADKADGHTDRLTVLETRADENRRAGAKYGAAWGAFVAAVIGGISAMFGGGK